MTEFGQVEADIDPVHWSNGPLWMNTLGQASVQSNTVHCISFPDQSQKSLLTGKADHTNINLHNSKFPDFSTDTAVSCSVQNQNKRRKSSHFIGCNVAFDFKHGPDNNSVIFAIILQFNHLVFNKL